MSELLKNLNRQEENVLIKDSEDPGSVQESVLNATITSTVGHGI